MGYTIFTASGTFTPSNFGLATNDVLFIKVVGGGGGGGYHSNEFGSSGGNSSFGSIASATGSGANNGQNGSSGLGFYSDTSSSGMYWYAGSRSSIGGNGGMGWAPGLLRDDRPQPMAVVYNMYGGMCKYGTLPSTNNNGIFNLLMNISTGASDSMTPGVTTALSGNQYYANCGGARVYSSGQFAISGVPGIGYGAGGSGGGNTLDSGGHGGHGGAITNTTYKLPNTNAITITVGAGGAGQNSSPYGGGGNAGCVAIWW